MNYNFSEDHIKDFVFNLFKEKLPIHCVYHNFNHTKLTVDAVKDISDEFELDSLDKENLIIAAWFHDTGYTVSNKNHEKESIEIARDYFKKLIDQDRFDKISNLILSTVYLSKKENLLEEILHDADFSNIGKKKFAQRAELLKCEWEKVNDKTYSDVEWAELQYEFITQKTFKTEVAEKKYGKRRERNVTDQRSAVEKAKNDQYKLHLKTETTKAKTQKEGRGIETLYRSVYNYHMELSSMADQKANIMISINTIVVSVIITLFGSGFTFGDSEGLRHVRFVFPMLLLVISSLISVTFAILSARPSITSKEKYEIERKDTSILFFGNFAQLRIKEFVDHIRKLKDSKDELYDSMTVDIYHLGAVLVKKYKLLKWSYNIFMGGLVLCVIGFIGITIYSY
jgi:predicted metal-dependent HD superfamily phosphohydrolase